jgi:hypothetical protein
MEHGATHSGQSDGVSTTTAAHTSTAPGAKCCVACSTRNAAYSSKLALRHCPSVPRILLPEAPHLIPSAYYQSRRASRAPQSLWWVETQYNAS